MPIRMRAARPLALVLAGSVLTPMLAFGAVGCGNSGSGGGTGGGGGTMAASPTVATNNAPAPGGGTGAGAGTMASPGMNGAGGAATAQPQHAGMSTKEKVVIIAGAALLYYLYKKHQATQQQAASAGGTTASGASPQLYRSSNGGIYYRNAQHQPVWVTAPSGGVAVPASQLQQYAPDYSQYQGQAAPPPPAGQATQSATQYDPSLSSAQ